MAAEGGAEAEEEDGSTSDVSSAWLRFIDTTSASPVRGMPGCGKRMRGTWSAASLQPYAAAARWQPLPFAVLAPCASSAAAPHGRQLRVHREGAEAVPRFHQLQYSLRAYPGYATVVRSCNSPDTVARSATEPHVPFPCSAKPQRRLCLGSGLCTGSVVKCVCALAGPRSAAAHWPARTVRLPAGRRASAVLLYILSCLFIPVRAGPGNIPRCSGPGRRTAPEDSSPGTLPG